MQAPLEQDDEGRAEAQRPVANGDQMWRRKDKCGLARVLACACGHVAYTRLYERCLRKVPTRAVSSGRRRRLSPCSDETLRWVGGRREGRE